MESPILRLTRAVQATSVASTPQNVSGLAVGQGRHARIFVDLRLCGDRSDCRVLTPPSAPVATVLTSSKLRFWHALEGKIKEEKTFRQGSWTVNCKFTSEKVCFFSPEGQSTVESVFFVQNFVWKNYRLLLVESTSNFAWSLFWRKFTSRVIYFCQFFPLQRFSLNCCSFGRV